MNEAFLDEFDFDSLLRQFQMFDRIWSGNSEVSVYSGGRFNLTSKMPAFTEGKVIYINKGFLEANCDSRILEVLLAKGLNLHELCHVMWTDISYVQREIKNDDNVWRAFNILEDCRIETLMSERYMLARQYFRILSGKLLKDWLLLYGRKTFLPASLVAKSETSCKFSDDAKLRIQSIIDRYIVSKRDDERIDLARELANELSVSDLAQLKTSENPTEYDGSGGRKNQPDTASLKDKISEAKKDIGEAKQKELLDTDEDVENNLSEISDELLNDAKNIFDSIAKSDVDFDRISGKLSRTASREGLGKPDGKETLLSNQLVNVFREIEFVNKGNKFGQTSGRLVIRDAFRHQKDKGLRIFDKKVKKLDTDISAAILIDFSGSMSRIVRDCAKVSRAMWNALHSVGQNAIVIGFDTMPEMIATEDKFNESVPAYGGGTQPHGAYELACKHLSRKSGNKLVIIVSDGEFDYPGEIGYLEKQYKIPTIMICWNSFENVKAKGCLIKFVGDQSEVAGALKKAIKEWMRKI